MGEAEPDHQDHLRAKPEDAGQDVLPRRVHHHLVRVCTTCGEAWLRLSFILRDAYRRLLSAPLTTGGPAPPHRDDLSASPAAAEALAERAADLRTLRRRAKQQLSELRTTPAHRRAGKVLGASKRFRSHLLAELLIAEARATVRNDPAEAESFAALVAHVLAWAGGPGEPAWATLLLARATAQRANALRVAGDLPAAERAFADLYRGLAQRPLGEPAALAEIASLEASLRIDQRHLEEADDLLDRAALSYRYAADGDGQARTLVKRANLAQALGRPAATLRLLDEVEGLEIAEAGHYQPSAVAARVAALCDLGRPAAARRHLHRHLAVFEADDSLHSAAVLRTLEGRTLSGVGEHAAAEEHFRTAVEILWELGRNYDVALAALDLAESLLAQGRTRELLPLAARLTADFRRRGVDREALEALGLVERAVRAEELTAGLLAEVRRKLRRRAPATAPIRA